MTTSLENENSPGAKLLPEAGQIISVTMNHGSCPVASVGRVERVSEHGFTVKAIGSFLKDDVEKGYVTWGLVPHENEEVERICDLAFFGYDSVRKDAQNEIKRRLKAASVVGADQPQPSPK